MNCWPRPYQQPHPPIWIPSQGSRETIEWASHPDRKYTYLQTFSPVAALARYMSMYRETAEALRLPGDVRSSSAGRCRPMCARPTRSRSREARPHIEFFFNKLLRMPQEMLLPPGYLSLASMQGVIAAKRALSTRQPDHRGPDREGRCSCAAARRPCARSSRSIRREIGFGYLLPTMQFGTLPHELTRKSIELFAREVIPHFRARATPAHRRGRRATA